MKQLLARTGSTGSAITIEAVMATAEKFNTGQEVRLQIPKEGTSGSQTFCISDLTVEMQRKRSLALHVAHDDVAEAVPVSPAREVDSRIGFYQRRCPRRYLPRYTRASPP
jgi:hypothetical protein